MSGNLSDLSYDDAAPERDGAGGKPLELLPRGTYEMVIIDSAVKSAKNGRGKYLELTLVVTKGPHEKRRLWERFNLWNENRQAVSIAKRQLVQLCQALGYQDPVDDSGLLHDKPMLVEVFQRFNKHFKEMENAISKFEPLDSRRATRPAQNTFTRPPQTQVADDDIPF